MTDADHRAASAGHVLACAAFPRDDDGPLHALVRSFRDGDPDAFEAVLAIVVAALGAPGGVLGAEAAGPVAVVVVPGHLAATGNPPCERLVEALAARFPVVRPAPGVLVRVADAPMGRLGGDRDPGAEAATLVWRPRLLPPARTVLLLDDVVRSGATLEAALRSAPPDVASRLVLGAVFRAEDARGR
jgi:hypothetical protein